MALRNRTNEFKNMRDKNNGNKFESDSTELLGNFNLSDNQRDKDNFNLSKSPSKSIGSDSDYIISLDKKLKENEEKIKNKILELEILQKKRLMVNFTDDEKSQEDKIEQMVKYIRDEIELNSKIILKLNGTKDVNDVFKRNLIESHVIKNQNLVKLLRQKQQDYLKKLKEQKKISSGSGLELWDKMGEKNVKSTNQLNAKPFDVIESFDTKSIGTEQKYAHEYLLEYDNSFEETVIAERDAEITNIVKSIEELSLIFKELNVLVHDQGTMLDRIDYNMECAVENVKSGVGQLDKADEHQKSAMSTQTKIIGGLTGMISIMIGLLILKKTKGF